MTRDRRAARVLLPALLLQLAAVVALGPSAEPPIARGPRPERTRPAGAVGELTPAGLAAVVRDRILALSGGEEAEAARGALAGGLVGRLDELDRVLARTTDPEVRAELVRLRALAAR